MPGTVQGSGDIVDKYSAFKGLRDYKSAVLKKEKRRRHEKMAKLESC